MYDDIANLHNLCFPHRPWSADEFRDLKKSGCDIIASQNGFIVWRTVTDEAEIITIGVAPDARGNGIGLAMLGLAEIDAKNNGATRMFLEVAEDNTHARKMYDTAGYKIIGRRPKYYNGIDAILMEKAL